MNPQTNTPPHHDPKKMHPMVILQPGERIITELKRHPFGILSMYVAGASAIAVLFLLAFMAPTLFETGGVDGTSVSGMLTIGALVISVGIGLILMIATTVYWQNRWVITDDSITQITQDSLFGRRVSQLSMENLEDVTVDQHGILQTMFNFGTLKAETAGEHSKFHFMYCPDPNKYARLILEIHENFIHQRRHQPQPVHPVQPLGDYAQQQEAYRQTTQQLYQQESQPQYQQPTPMPHPVYQQQPTNTQAQQPYQPQQQAQTPADQQPQQRNHLPPPLQ